MCGDRNKARHVIVNLTYFIYNVDVPYQVIKALAQHICALDDYATFSPLMKFNGNICKMKAAETIYQGCYKSQKKFINTFKFI